MPLDGPAGQANGHAGQIWEPFTTILQDSGGQ